MDSTCKSSSGKIEVKKMTNINKSYYIGIDIGGTKCAVILGVVNENIEILERYSCETKKGSKYKDTIEEIFTMINTVMKKRKLNHTNISAVGISCGGPLDSRKGEILSPPNLIGWDKVPIVRMVEEQFHIPTFLQNDANAGALAEWQFGAGRGYQNVIFLTFGTGMGAGLILNSTLYEGTNNMAGEVGHIRLEENGPVGYGKTGSFEGFCSGGGIVQIARSKVTERLQRGEHPVLCPTYEKLEELSARSVSEAAYAGDKLAIETFRCSAIHLGKALSILIDILNPQVIVIGSVYARSKELFEGATLETVRNEAFLESAKVCKIIPSGLGDYIGDYAALSVAVIGKAKQENNNE